MSEARERDTLLRARTEATIRELQRMGDGPRDDVRLLRDLLSALDRQERAVKEADSKREVAEAQLRSANTHLDIAKGRLLDVERVLGDIRTEVDPDRMRETGHIPDEARIWDLTGKGLATLDDAGGE